MDKKSNNVRDLFTLLKAYGDRLHDKRMPYITTK